MTDTPTPPAMTPEQRSELINEMRYNSDTIYSDTILDQLEADGVTIATLTADRDGLIALAEDLSGGLFDANKERDAAQAEIARLTAALDAERDRCMRIVSAARNGDIDQDMRTILHFMDCGDQMVFDADKHEYIPDHVAKDRALIAALTKGAAT